MNPLPNHDAATLRQTLARVHALMESRNWTGAYEALGVLENEHSIQSSPSERGEWLLLRARCAVELGRYREAVDLGRDAFATFQHSLDTENMAVTQSTLGRAYLGLGESKNARIQARDALATYRRLGDLTGMARAHNDLARIHFVRGEYDVAIEHLTDGMDIYRQVGDRESETRMLGNLGRIHLLIGRWPEAQDVLSRALSAARESGNRVSMCRNLLSLAFLASLRHSFNEAAEHLDAALACVETTGLARERAIYHEYAGVWHYEQKHWIQAKESFRRALNIGRHLSDENDLVSQSLRGIAECELAIGDWQQAHRLAEEGLLIAIAIGERSEAGCLYRARALAEARLGRHDDAAASLERAKECLNLVGDVYELAKIDLAEAEILQSAARDAESAVAAVGRARTRFQQIGASDQDTESQWFLADLLRRQGRLTESLQAAIDAVRRLDASGSEESRERLERIANECVTHAVSGANEFRLGGAPWTPATGSQDGLEALQRAIDFYRERLGASRALLIETTAGGERSGQPLAVSGASNEFAEALATFAASPYQRHLVTDAPRVIWSVQLIPELAASLTSSEGHIPESIITVPVALGPAASGLLYADVIAGPAARQFQPRDIDFAVAFAEVVAWYSTRMRSEGLFRDVQRLRDQVARESDFPSILTQNENLRQVLTRVRLVVDADVSILLQGETGTGKDLLAKAIHYSSNRRDQRFVSVNCAALPESLLESELFGAKRGAYTGADRDKMGLFEEADGGTFFLDEIGEMPLSIQAKLLRLLETKEFTRLGDTKPRHVDVRVVSATNRDLTEEIERGTFRRDLYYRLSPVTFTLPPLRERPEDIPLLINHFLSRIAADNQRKVTIGPEVVRRMSAYHWPGNVRELENEIRKLVLLSGPNESIGLDRLGSKFSAEEAAPDQLPERPIPEGFSLYDHVANLEKRFILRALAETAGIKKHAASRLGIPESTLRLKIRQYDISEL